MNLLRVTYPIFGVLVAGGLLVGCNEKHPQAVATPPPVVLVSQPVWPHP